MNTLPIGWVGLGKMGNAIVQNLLKNGCRVHVYNRTKQKEAEAVEAGALSQQSMQQLVHNSSIIFTMVSDDDAVKEVFTGEQGLLSHSPSGKIFVDMSTVSPQTSRFLADICRDSRNEFVDAPVSGSIKPAQEGSLTIMTGGDIGTLEKVKPVFDIMGKTTHLGSNGAGSSAKLAINYLLGLQLQGLAEAVLFARDNGIKPADFLSIINESALGNTLTKGKSALILQNEFPAAFALKHLVKDLRLAGEQGIKAPLFLPLLHSYEQALQDGMAEEDCMAIFKCLQQNRETHPEVENIYPDHNISDYAN